MIILRLLFFGVLLGSYICGEEVEVQQIKNPVFGILMATHLMAMVALSGLPVLLPIANNGDTLAGFLISLLWAAYAVGILVFSRQNNDKLLATSSLFIFGAAAGKALIFDVANVEPLGRIACLLALGVALYVGGLLYRRISIWNTQTTETE
ncbi:MAG TPA: DUF2339 domain-containing protein [Myxococcales bacterium]|nr:DUF2339 domain-containing protein [Myxococcales bacterium]